MNLDNFDQLKFERFLVSLAEKDAAKVKSLETRGIPLSDADPFSAIFECATLGISMSEWLETYESRRLRQKTLQNHIGNLHEVAISCFAGWEISASTADVENRESKVIAEIKNKHNTMNSSSALATYRKLEQLVDGAYEGFQSFVVQIIPYGKSGPYRINFTPSDSSKKNAKRSPSRDDICLIDGESFYALVNGGKLETMTEVYKIMMESMKKIFGKQAEPSVRDSVSLDFINAIRPSLR